MRELLKRILVATGLRHHAKGQKVSQVRKAEILLAYKQPAMVTFVETGTSTGGMIEALKRHFGKIHSIELDDHLYAQAVKKFLNETNVHLYHGDSAKEIHTVLQQITSPSLFWLDAHGAGKINFHNAPIKAELRAIFSHPVSGHIIIIDDARHFNRCDIRCIQTASRLHNYQCVIEEGIFRLTPYA